MTHQQQVRFVCNRCNAERIVDLQNTADPMGPPEGWWQFWLNDKVRPPEHFCPNCARDYVLFARREL